MRRRRASRRIAGGRGPWAGPPFGTSHVLRRAGILAAHGLPLPEPVALIRRSAPGWTFGGDSPRGVDEWAAALTRCLPERVTVRPHRAPYGLRLGAIERDLDHLVDHHGRRWYPRPFAAMLLDAGHAWVVERRDEDHPGMDDLAPDEPSPTIVAVTLLDAGDVRLVSHDVRVGVRPGRHARRPGYRFLRGASLVHARPRPDVEDLPGWPGVAHLLVRAARATPTTPVVGWDVLVTERGPLIADAWDPLETPPRGAEACVVEAMRSASAGGRPPGTSLVHR